MKQKKCRMECNTCQDKCLEYRVAEYLHQKGITLVGKGKKKCAGK